MKIRVNHLEKKPKGNPAHRPSNWKAFFAAHWIFSAKAMAQMRTLARLARPLNKELSEFCTARWERLPRGST